MEIAYCEVFLRCRESSAAIETTNRRRRLYLFRSCQMGRCLRSARPFAFAYRRDSKTSARIRNLGFPLGYRFSAAAMERRNEQMERDASSVHAHESRGHAVARSEEIRGGASRSLRRCA